jgi:prepilin-type N-terminal cleavage/methylation domain-containing protein
MSFFRVHKNSGFTIIEITVAIGVIAILSTAVYAGAGVIREKARDAQRKSDLEQIQLALRLYKEDFGTYPVINTGEKIGDGSGALDASLASYLPSVPQDPKMSSDATYYYFYDSQSACAPQGPPFDDYIVLFSVKTEKPQMANWGQWPSTAGVCRPNGSADGNPTAATYGILLQKTP